MAERHAPDLHYGNVGDPSYSRDGSGRWTWLRRSGSVEPLRLLSETEVYLKPSQHRVDGFHLPPVDEENRHAEKKRHLQGQLGYFTKTHPLIASVVELLPQLLPNEECDPVSSFDASITGKPCLAIGRILRKSTATSRPVVDSVTAVALLDLKVPATLRLVVPQNINFGWTQEKRETTTHLPVPDFKCATWSTWRTDDGPIQQLCFADATARGSSFLAVRSASSIAILNPIYEHAKRSRGVIGQDRFNIVPNCVTRLSRHNLHNGPIVDMAFNPWNQRHLGVVDGDGNWVVWDIGELATRTKSKQRPVSLLNGHFPSAVVNDPPKRNLADKSNWYKVSWIGNSQTILLCNRYRLCAFDLKRSFTPLDCPDLQLFDLKLPILDLKQSSSHNGQLLLLTSTHFCVLELESNSELSESRPKISLAMFWMHHRDPKDLSLRISCHGSHEGAVVILFSQETTLATVFTLLHSTKSTEVESIITDASLLNLRGTNLFSDDSGSARLDRLSDLFLLPVPYVHSATSRRNGDTRGEVYETQGVHFYSLLTLTQKQIFASTLCCFRYGKQADEISPLVVRAPSWDRHSSNPSDEHEHVSSGFIVADDHVESDGTSSSSHGIASNRRRSRGNSLNHVGPQERHPMPYELVYDELNENQATHSLPLIQAIQSLADRLVEKFSDGTIPWKTIADEVGMNDLVGDVGKVSNSLTDLIRASGSKDQRNSKITALAHTQQLRLGHVSEQGLTVSAIYNHIIDHWLAPLSGGIPGKTRLAREKIARQVAAQVCLSSFVTQTTKQDLLAADTEEMPAVVRLRKYARIDKGIAPLPKQLDEVLDHWRIGGNPGAYNYDDTVTALSQVTTIGGAVISAEVQEKVRRKAERDAARKLRHEQAGGSQPVQNMPWQSSQPIRRTPWQSSQPAAGAALQESSQPSESQSQSEQVPVVASQIERGKYARRVAPKPKPKSGRRAGF